MSKGRRQKSKNHVVNISMVKGEEVKRSRGQDISGHKFRGQR